MEKGPTSLEAGGGVGEFLSTIDSSKKVLILPHDNPDPDSLASAAALRFLIRHKLNKIAVIGLSGIIGRSENRSLVTVLEIPLVPVSELLPNFSGSVILVDSQPQRGNNALPAEITPTAVIDHHPDWGKNSDIPFVDIRESYGATSTIVTEYLQHAEVPLDPRIATALFYGISSETQHLGRETMPHDIVASQFLYPYVNKRLLGDIQTPQLSPTYFRVIASALNSALLYGDTVVTILDSVPYPDAVAEVADYLMRLETAQWSVCMAPHEDFVYVSMRTRDAEAQAGRLLDSLLPSGSAGGHGMIAGGRVKASRRQRDEIIQKISSDILQALGKTGTRPQPLVAEKPRPAEKPRKTAPSKATAARSNSNKKPTANGK